ncbi:glycoside hydrolase family 31 protein [Mesoplasma seiffertii]|uniref:glycoside hydrolase family 31 protein n=1 Tax=Mesoplasma seiffertii TaxID=28224 RepID=UPI00068628E6|nr:glycoside hydrolase family 31 protein [Mesoplasma seiffertii]
MTKINNSSLSVKPSNKVNNITTTFRFKSIEKIDATKCKINFENRVSIFIESFDDIVRAQIVLDQKIINDKISHNFIKEKVQSVNTKQIKIGKAKIKIDANKIAISNKKNYITIEKIYLEDDLLTCSIQSSETDRFFGFGEKTGLNLDKKFTDTSNWATDLYKAHSDEDRELYGAVNFNIINKNIDSNIGVFVDNPTRVKYNMKSSDKFIIQVDQNDLDIYFILENSIKNTISKYFKLTGMPFLPTKWALGHHLSRHSYENTAKIHELIKMSMSSNIYLDAVYLDILYMDKMKSFTVDQKRFENLKKLVIDCRKKGVEIVPIVNPGIKAEDTFNLYIKGKQQKAFIKDSNNNREYLGEVWPGLCAFPDFFNQNGINFWKQCLQFYLKNQIKGIWLDMNEPAVFNDTHTVDVNALHNVNGETRTHHEVHNNYGTYQVKATYEAMLSSDIRPHIVTRSCAAGVQKYAAVWTGDNFSYWFQLRQSLPMILNMGLSGIPMAGQDIGGFEYDASAELLTRWYQANVFFGLFRNHCSIGKRFQEPWSFNDKTTKAIASVVKLRYKLIPTLYTEFFKVHTEGKPFAVPLLYNFENDLESYNIDDQYMVNSIMVAPILQKNTFKRIVYLPKNQKGWIDYETKQFHKPGKSIIRNIDYHQMGIFIENQSMIFTNPDKKKTNGFFSKVVVEIFDMFNNSTIKSIFFDDDGLSKNSIEKNEYEHIEFIYKAETGIVYYRGLNKDFKLAYIKSKFEFILVNENKKISIERHK